MSRKVITLAVLLFLLIIAGKATLAQEGGDNPSRSAEVDPLLAAEMLAAGVPQNLIAETAVEWPAHLEEVARREAALQDRLQHGEPIDESAFVAPNGRSAADRQFHDDLETALLNEEWQTAEQLLAQRPNAELSAWIEEAKNGEETAVSPDEIALVPPQPKAPGALLTVGSACAYSNLQAALDVANDGDSIQMEQGIWAGDANGSVTVSDSINIYGGYDATCTNPMGTDTILDGTGGLAATVMTIQSNNTVALYNVQITNGDAVGIGGGLVANNNSDVTLWSSDVYDNSAQYGAGVYANIDAVLHLENGSKIYDNYAAIDGGGLYCLGGTVHMNGVSIGVTGGNLADGWGGGVHLKDCDLYYENQAYNPIENNQAALGGGIFATDGSLIVIHTANNAGPKGNTATAQGGGIYLTGSSELQAHGANINANTATSQGGGLYIGGNATAYFVGDNCLESSCGQSKMQTNSADRGGAIYVNPDGTLDVSGLYLYNNTAYVQGSAMEIHGTAAVGNLAAAQGTSADHVIYIADGGSLDLAFSTIYENGDFGAGTAVFGLAPTGSLVGKGIITWDNFGTVNDVGSAGGVNIVDSLLQFAPTNGVNNLIGQDPLFGLSYHLKANSPAIDYVTSPLPADPFDLDQEPRPNFGGTAYDAGADEVYELIGINGAGCNYSSIQDAISAASNSDTIYITSGSYSERFIINKDLTFVPAIDDCTTIDLAATSDTVIVDGSELPWPGVGSAGGLVYMDGNVTVEFRHMTFQNGLASFGGALYLVNGAYVVLDDVDIRENTAWSYGGGVAIRNNANLYMQNGSRIIDNTTNGVGGGAFADLGGTITMQDASRIGDFNLGNTADEDGGGVYLSDSDLSMSGTARVRSNTAVSNGGGIYADGASTIEMEGQSYIGWSSSTGGNEGQVGAGAYLTDTAAIAATENSRIQYNVTIDQFGSEFGGGIAAYGNSSILLDDNVLVQNNTALTAGGGIFLYSEDEGAVLTMQNGATVQDNSGPLGGGIYAWDNVLITLNNAGIIDNLAGLRGGGLRLYGEAQGDLTQATITGNEANEGGGIALGAFVAIPQIVISDSVIDDNTAVNGGGIHSVDGAVEIYGDCSISGNDASSFGGGIYSVNETFQPLLQITPWGTGEHCLISGNTAVDGAGLYLDDTILSLQGNLEVNGNSASGHGGGLYAVGNLSEIGVYSDHRLSFLLNSATSGSGGGLYLLDVTGNNNYLHNVDIMGNVAGGEGGGIYADNSIFSMRNNIVQGNYAGVNGGGLAARNNAGVTIEAMTPPAAFMEGAGQCNQIGLPADRYCSEFVGNSTAAAGYGGGIHMEGGAMVDVADTAFMGNSADYGAAIYAASGAGALTVENGRFTDNAAATDSAIRVWGSDFTMSNSTIAGNTGGTAVSIPGAATNVAFTSNIVWDNSDGVASAAPIGGGGCGISQNGVGGAMDDPLFTTTARGAYHPGVGSSAIDACLGGTAHDLDNIARPQNGLYDMGAFEACGVASVSVSSIWPDVTLDWSGSGLQTVYQSAQPYQLGSSAGDYMNSYTHFGGALAGGTAYYYYVGCPNTPQVGAFNFAITPGS